MRALLLAVLIFTGATTAQASSEPQVRLYAMDCGRLDFSDLAPFADTGEYDGHPGTLMASCYLIRHPRGDLLWDTGIGDKYSVDPAGVQLPNYRAIVRKTVQSQLREIGLDFSDIEFFAFSHGHADHLGNADRLGKAQWIANPKELAWLASVPSPPRTNLALISARDASKTISITGDHDVFGDGSVKILSAPGHTPGHQVLLVRLAKHGPLLLSGDLYHSHENRQGRRMPVFNVSRAETLASMERIESIMRNQRARLVIQHSVADFDSLPHSPIFLD